MSMKKMNSIFLATVFLIGIFLPIVFADKKGGGISPTENRTLAKFPEIFSTQNIRDDVENWINDNVGFREQLLNTNAFLNYRLFHTSPTDRVMVGKNDWFFYTWDHNIDIAKGTYPLTQEMLEKIKSTQERIQRALKQKGIEYVLVLTPSKASVYPEMIGGCNFSVRQTPIDIVTDYLKKNTTINVVNTKPALIDAKDNQTVFFQTDTHWNEEGAFIGYKTMMQHLYQNGLIDVPPIEIEQIPSVYKGEFSSMMGNRNLLPPEEINATKIINPKAIEVQNEDLLNEICNEQTGHNFFSTGCHFYENTSCANKKILMYGDSYFGGWKVQQLVAENCSHLDFIWSDYIKDNIVKKTKPDILIFERTERYINTLAQDCDPRLLTQPLENPNAELHSDYDEIHKNQNTSIKITMKNLSNSSMSEDGWVRLCIFPDGKEAGYRVNIPDNLEIKPSETYTFTIDNIDQYVGDNNYLEFQMVEEGITYFGQRIRIDLKE
ncbi:MAG: ALGX domain-containing protein [Oscillospiraceae bacterium]|jgi:alginate O-acetyltransferase complex protein AlgJ